MEAEVPDCDPDGMPLVVRVAKVTPGTTTPAPSTGQPRSPDLAHIDCTCYLEDAGPRYDYSLHLYFDEGLPVLREQWWGSRSSLEEVLAAAELCGVPRACWTETNEERPPAPDLPDALQPHEGPRLVGSRSYELAFWPRGWADGVDPDALFEALLDEGIEPGPTSATPTGRFIDAVLDAWPYVPGAARDASPWYSDPRWDLRPHLARLDLQLAAVDPLLSRLVAAANEHGLHAYDPQTRSLL